MNSRPSALLPCVSGLQDEGVAGILATVITADLDAMCRRLANICRVREADRAIAEMIWGIHIEGPFLNEEPGYIGAHPKRHRPAGRLDAASACSMRPAG